MESNKKQQKLTSPSRREFLTSIAALSGFPFLLSEPMSIFAQTGKSLPGKPPITTPGGDTSIIGGYGSWAAGIAEQHENIMSKSLFCAGTTWPGVTLAEDKKALDILCARPDVDIENVDCCGLSGGGLRTNYLAGLDHRIKCSVSVGFMSTWKDFLLNKSFTHT